VTAARSDYDIVGIGVATLDVISVVDDFPHGEEVRQARAIVMQGGGPVATAVAAAAQLGADTAMLDALGDDSQGGLVRDQLSALGVDTNHIVTREGGSSPAASIWVRAADGARSIAFSPGDVDELTAHELPMDVLLSAGILHLNGRHLDACLHACEQVHGRGPRISFDGGAGRYRHELDPLLPMVDICIVARDFGRRFSGSDDIAAMITALHAAGPGLVAVTDGVRGSWVSGGTGIIHQPAVAVEKAADTTGCGDVYHGAFLYGLARDMAPADCARLAAAAAALNAQAVGGRGRLASGREISQLLNWRT